MVSKAGIGAFVGHTETSIGPFEPMHRIFRGIRSSPATFIDSVGYWPGPHLHVWTWWHADCVVVVRFHKAGRISRFIFRRLGKGSIGFGTHRGIVVDVRLKMHRIRFRYQPPHRNPMNTRRAYRKLVAASDVQLLSQNGTGCLGISWYFGRLVGKRKTLAHVRCQIPASGDRHCTSPHRTACLSEIQVRLPCEQPFLGTILSFALRCKASGSWMTGRSECASVSRQRRIKQELTAASRCGRRDLADRTQLQ